MPNSSIIENVESAPLTDGQRRAIFSVALISPWTALWGFWCMVTGVLGLDALSSFGIHVWGGGILRICGVAVNVSGRERLPANQSCIFISNHQSALDIPILIAACRQTHQVRFMAKESLFKIPFLGWGMRCNGFIPIRRESARHSAETFKDLFESKAALKHSYVIFPEGTRSPDGRLQPLKRGAIGLALRLNKPIVPVSLINACHANPKGRWIIRPGSARIVFHEPILIEENAARSTRDDLLERLYSAIASALPADQQPVKGPD